MQLLKIWITAHGCVGMAHNNNEILLDFVINLQGQGFIFLHLCSNVCIGYEINVVKG
jgi:hypothetical protein